ncbi:MAG: hydrogenase expression/formation protein HypE [Lacibacter sp.]|jgi:hydrogenase expression/formation protein HypE
MPKFDFDTINMGHGSGGILTHQLLNSGVFSILQNDMLNQKHDGAIFTANGKLAFSTDSYVIHPLFFPGGNIGELAVNGTVNDLAMCGAMAKYLSLSFIIEEGLAMKEFWEILVSIKKACDKANVQVVTGDTKVVEKGKGDKIFINTSGIGIMHPHANIALSNIKEGDAVILSGYIADHGVCIMSKREGLEFETDVKSDTVNLNFTIEHLLNEFGNEIHFLRDATRGGVASVLNEIAKDGNLGVDILEKEIPVKPQVSGACEMLGLDPLYVANEGKFMMVVDAAKTQDVLNALRKDTNGTDATIIGHITKEHIGQVILQSRIGGKRVVNMLPGEQLPRIC